MDSAPKISFEEFQSIVREVVQEHGLGEEWQSAFTRYFGLNEMRHYADFEGCAARIIDDRPSEFPPHCVMCLETLAARFAETDSATTENERALYGISALSPALLLFGSFIGAADDLDLSGENWMDFFERSIWL
ncbi:TPA: hypothetical protein EYP38_03410 [Candidatus Micrarchaeota archaeon]|nr:hypothetical protein [Candidatus Micrarchaeota archaeon]